jgi:hypothetical protein
MTILSTRSKETIKTGLAMAISYGVALQLGWDNPKWAGIAVAMISLSTAGQSLNKGAMRMLGTLVGLAAALTFLAIFPQDRWLFMVVLSLYVGFCTYTSFFRHGLTRIHSRNEIRANLSSDHIEVLFRVRWGTDHCDFYRPFEMKFEQIMQHIQGGRNTNGLIHRLSRV